MKAIAVLLILGVFIRHVAVNWLDLGLSTTALFYTFGGAWESILCLTILVLISAARESIWKSLIQFAMIVGSLEGAQIAVCRPFVHDLSKVPAGVDLCDYLLGFPFGKAVMVFYFLVLIWIVGRKLAKPTS